MRILRELDKKTNTMCGAILMESSPQFGAQLIINMSAHGDIEEFWVLSNGSKFTEYLLSAKVWLLFKNDLSADSKWV